MSAIANIRVTLASAVTNTNTVTVAYPSGTTQATLIGSTGGQAVNAGIKAPQAAAGAGTVAFTFGTSDITVTNNTGVTWAAGSELLLSFGDTTLNGAYESAIRVPAPVALTAATGTASNTIADVTASPTQTLVNNNFKSVAEKINAILTALKNAGITV